MRLTEQQILDRVSRTEAERNNYAIKAEIWENMWRLKQFELTPLEAVEQNAQEQVTLPTPRNVVNLAQRLISTLPKIDVPSPKVSKEADALAEKTEAWLSAVFQSANRQQNRNLISDATWQSLVRGRFCFEVKWIGDVLPERLKKTTLPILIRTLDPLNVGIKRGPIYTHWAYHKCDEERLNVMASFPKLKLDEIVAVDTGDDVRTEKDTVEVVDFWWTSPTTGDIWNAILVNGRFAKKPSRTDYPDIPIIENYGDTAPIEDEEYRGMSILDPIRELWPYQNRLASQMGTGLLWYFWPSITVMNEHGEEVGDIKIKPGETTHLPMGTTTNVIQISPNVPLATLMDGRIDAEIQNSTFPGVMYGKAPGELSAGYGVSLLSDAAKGRIKSTLENLEFGIARVCQMVLGLVAAFGDNKDGVAAWGIDDRTTKAYRLSMTKKEAQDFCDVVVSLKPQVPQDLQQVQTLGLRLVEAGIISIRTYRDKFMSITIPSDEQARVELEKAFNSEAIAPVAQDSALELYFGKNWKEELGIVPPPPPEPPPAPPEMMGPPQGPPMQGPPPGMMQQGPPMPPGQSEAVLTGPMGGGIPPELSGQLTPEMMGMPADMDPIEWARLTGRPMPPAQELNRLQGLPQGG
ncbi:MAG: hypothetical protein IPL32_18220 [Chloracidobacterium sp.]|nr:hypothetical protein [Chloracidobacterium sp.]